jgi:hypothetical protein
VTAVATVDVAVSAKVLAVVIAVVAVDWRVVNV